MKKLSEKNTSLAISLRESLRRKQKLIAIKVCGYSYLILHINALVKNSSYYHLKMAQEFQYFYEDEVFRFSNKGQLELGMVLENAEFVPSDEDSDQEEEAKVTKGSIRVAWYPKGEEQVLPERKVGLGDRSLMPGDVVRRLIKGKDTQRGYCRQVHVAASVQVVGTKFVIININSNSLTPLEEFTTDIAVALDSWVGMVNMVKCKIKMVTSDGSKCVLSDHEALDLDDVRDTRDRDSEFRRYDFYPGQQLVGPSRIFEDAEWTFKSKERENGVMKSQKFIKVTVEEVQVVQLGVRWQCRAFSNDPNFDKEQPKYIVQGDDLKRVRMLNVFEPCTLQLGDRNYYVMKDGDVLLTREQWRKLASKNLMGDQTNPCPLRPRPSKRNKPVENVSSKSSVEDQVSAVQNHILPSDETETNAGVDSDDFVDIDTDDVSDGASVSSEASTCSQSKRNKKGPALMTKVLKKRKLKRAKRKIEKPESSVVKPGDRLVVETLMTTSKADVVWQDGSVENCIPSTVLYPIHHLDDQEFFPGDFVIEQKDSFDTHEYGVIQRVDHAGRTARVKWFHTYTAGKEPQPLFKCEQEVSVYDLRDHPDFRYRPGSVVIRVANYENGQTCSTGQVLDNFPSGEVSVWWVDGTKSVCYPQDLYKVGEYDSDEGELWDDTASEESWETESEHSIIAEESESENDNQLKTKLVANIEKARIAMSRLEEIFTQNPALQTTAVMKQLLDCYKECRCMDKLMGTYFFHESNFQGLIEKVRERGRASSNQRMAEQFNRLFSTNPEPEGNLSSVPNDKMDVNGLDFPVEENICVGNKTPSSSKKTNKIDRKVLDGIVSSTVSNKNDILQTSNNLCENLANLSLTSSPSTLREVVILKRRENLSNSNTFEISGSKESESNIFQENHNDVDFKLLSPLENDASFCSDSETKLGSALVNGESSLSATDGFQVLEAAPDCHKFKLTMFQPNDPPHFYRTVRKEMKLLSTSLPPGIWVRGYEDRMDLYSVMIRGPERTPYEGGLFFFDFQLSADYPRAPPLCHYVTYCSDKLNPNLYEDGKVCVSLLGTWSGKGTEVWTSQSNLLQVIISIQGLILVSEPYFNEAGYERQKGTQQGRENSRMYNEMVVLKLVQAMAKVIQNPPVIFRDEILWHFNEKAFILVSQLEKWLLISENYNTTHPFSPTTPTTFRQIATQDNVDLPEYPLIPASKGFCITLRKTLENFKYVLKLVGVWPGPSSALGEVVASIPKAKMEEEDTLTEGDEAETKRT
ncbi:(E3-independent) E2 ubiquitin-conjugating enzyme UBE2O [Armadillidium nasatum]|uniref:(E3-independent) E2 ubiquitin-conjugating enzyme UBE2O n=2 Tax=Armadillidium nasatum TaxID=96803 RepID=A0A5N5SKK3_9CRUS|nr:(E3-independent) E2 ubiquitin-conjugating enzyme UBE2O [Armadillidium nasatum]